MSPKIFEEDYVSSAKAARLLGCNTKRVPNLAANGFLTVRRLPGCDPRYLLSDVRRLAIEWTVPASRLADIGQGEDVRVESRESDPEEGVKS